MSFTLTSKSIHLITEKLTQLLELVQPPFRDGLFAFFDQKIKKVIEPYTSRQAFQVLLRLTEKSNATFSKKNWKGDETNYLIFIIDKYSLTKDIHPKIFDQADWENISEYLPDRTGSACKFRFLTLTPANITNEPWTSQERQLLLRIIQNQKSNTLNWKIVSEQLYQFNPTRLFRTGKQCRQHYTCFLRPNLKKGSWTEQQDYELIRLFLLHGKKWSKMTQQIEGRNQNSIKNRFFLMFQNKKQVRLTNSDLIKIVKRRKQKIQKKLMISREENSTFEEDKKINSSNTDSSKDQIEQPQQESNSEEQQSQIQQKGQIFIKQEGCRIQQPRKVHNSIDQSHQQYYMYINF